MLGIGIIGVGFYGRRHAEAIRKLPSAKLIAASRTNERKLEKFCSEFQVEGYPNYKDLLKRDDIHAVVIAVPHHLHRKITIDAASANKHILLEKPMAHTIDDCKEINEVVSKAGINLMIGHNMRFFRSSILGKQIIDSGELGEPILGRSTISKNWMTNNRKAWHLDANTGGGMLMTVGIHFIDVLSWLLNSQVESVRAQVLTKFHDQTADDIGLLFLQYENGLTGTVTSIGYKTGVTEFLTEITCTNGILKIDHLGGVYIGKNEEWSLVSNSIVQYPEEEALYIEWKTFLRSIVEKNSSPISGAYGEHMVRIIEAAKWSSKKKQEIKLGEMEALY